MKLYKPDEPFVGKGVNSEMTIGDFWSFQFSNIYLNPDEIAEYIVAKALGKKEPDNRESWTEYDINYQSVRIEVKETAYYHPWNETVAISRQRSFDIHQLKSEDTGEMERKNDIYVFCLLKGENEEDAYPLNLDNWEFYVIPTAKINEECKSQKTLSLGRVREIAAKKTEYKDLKTEINSIIKGCNLQGGGMA